MTLGLMSPIEAYGHAHWNMPIMAGQVTRLGRADIINVAATAYAAIRARIPIGLQVVV
ncbi:MAG: hypothetical protein QF670_02775 [Alphaproteobacteria bacterium]|nr:hypothetical protein [Alphaproteobacteria bacterium]